MYTFNGNCKLRLLYGFVGGGGGVVKETGQQFLLRTHNTRKCVLRLHTDKNDSKVKTSNTLLKWGKREGGGGLMGSVS